MDYYSLKMRASQQVGEGGQKHEQHISGAERIVGRDSVEAVCTAMVRRAMNHSKGDPDFINVKIEKVHESDIQILKALPVTRIDVDTWQEGLDKAFGLVSKAVAECDERLLRGAREDLIKDFAQKLPELLRATFPMRGRCFTILRRANAWNLTTNAVCVRHIWMLCIRAKSMVARIILTRRLCLRPRWRMLLEWWLSFA